jgi:hypothetical protein
MRRLALLALSALALAAAFVLGALTEANWYEEDDLC